MKPNFYILLFGLVIVLILGLNGTVLAQESPKVLKISGKAEILRNGKWYRAKAGQELLTDQAIRMAKGGEVVLTSNEGKIEIVVSSGSTVKYRGLVPEKSVPWISKVQPVRAKSPLIPEFELLEGQTYLSITQGQPMRLMTPLVMAAVRGTSFSVSVTEDGSSAISVTEGSVLAMGRTGKTRVVKAGTGYALTAQQYTDFLRKKGLTIPPEGWRNIPYQDLEAQDAKTFKTGAPSRAVVSPARPKRPSRRPSQTSSSNISAIKGASYGIPSSKNTAVSDEVASPGLDQAEQFLDLKATLDRRDFRTPSDKGYQSTAKITASYKGSPVTTPVTWQVIDVANPKASWWLRAPSAQNGLTWGETADGTSFWEEDDVLGTEPTGATVTLTDVVGSRTVTVMAITVIDGNEVGGTVEIKFGTGPLSVFNSKPQTEARWAAESGNSSVSKTTQFGDFTDTANEFPAAQICKGKVDNTDIILGGSAGAWTARFPRNRDWIANSNSPNTWFAESANLPKPKDLFAVARYEPNNEPNFLRKGAAMAANWPEPGGDQAYLTGEISFDPALGIFQSTKVTLGHKRPGTLNFNSEIFKSAVDEANFGVICGGR